MNIETIVRRELKDDTLELIADSAGSTTYGRISEVAIANPWDAGAHNIVITYDKEHGTLTIADDGRGMAPGEGLEDFYRVGGSMKKNQKTTPEGRPTWGKFGIGTINLYKLCGNYSLRTVHNGRVTTIKEVFNEELNSRKQIRAKTKTGQREKNGTTIIMKDLKFTESLDTTFSFPGLIRHLRKDFSASLSDDFTITVNGTRLTPMSYDTSRHFHLDALGKHMGHVSGVVYYTRAPNEDAGVHLFVNGRRHGTPEYFKDSSGAQPIRRRLVAQVHANDLDRVIMMDRGRVREDDAGFEELRDTVRKYLRRLESKIRTDMERETTTRRADEANSVLEKVAKDLRKRLSAHGDYRTLEIRIVAPSVVDTHAGETDSNVVGIKKGNIIYLRNDLETLQVAEGFAPRTFYDNVVHAAIDALALTSAIALKSKGREADPFDIRTQLIRAFYTKKPSKVVVERSSSNGKELYEYELFDEAEIARRVEKPIGVVRQLMDSGGLSTVEIKDVRGVNVREARGDIIRRTFEELRPWKSLYEIIYETDRAQVTLSHRVDDFTQRFLRTIDQTPYLFNASVNGSARQSVWVMQEYVPHVQQLIADGKPNAKKDRNELVELATAVGNQDEAAKFFGLKQNDIECALKYAASRGIPVRRLDMPTSGIKGYLLFDVAVAYRAMRVEDSKK